MEHAAVYVKVVKAVREHVMVFVKAVRAVREHVAVYVKAVVALAQVHARAINLLTTTLELPELYVYAFSA